MNNEFDFLGLLLIFIGIGAVVAYVRRDKSQDEIKQQAFIDSITVGLRDHTRKPE